MVALNNQDIRFTRPLYTVAQAARWVGMSPATLTTWAKGYRRTYPERRPVEMGPVITSVEAQYGATIPFIGLVEAAVVQAFRSTGLPMQRVRRALGVLSDQNELHNALASKKLYTDGAQVLYEYAEESEPVLRLLTVVHSGQRVFHDVIDDYLKRITFGDEWATELILPVTRRELLRVRPRVASGDPLFVHGGAPLSAVVSRRKAGESIESLAYDYEVPSEDIEEALHGILPAAA